MTTLPSAAALAVLVLVAGIGGVVAADPTAAPTATPTAVETTSKAPASAEPTQMPPERDGSFEERLAHRLSEFNLTDGQVRVIVNDAVRLRDDGASRLVIRSSIVMHLYEFGVDAPFLYANDGDGLPAADRLAERLGARFDLTDEQVAEIAATIERMHADGATRAEIYRAVGELLVSYGIDEDEIAELRERFLHAKAHRLHARAHHLHERSHRLHHAAGHDGPTTGDAVDRRVDRLQDRYDLTEEQAAALERLVRGMLADGEPRDAVAEAVRERLHDWRDGPADRDVERHRRATARGDG